MPFDDKIWTTAKDVDMNNDYVKNIKKAFETNENILNNTEKRSSIVLLCVIYDGDDEELKGKISYIIKPYNSIIRKEKIINHYTWIEVLEENVEMNEFHLKPTDRIKDDEGNCVKILQIEIRTCGDWKEILSK